MPFSADQIEDGSGKPNAVVYDTEANCADYLSARGLTSFASASGSIGSVEKQQIYLLRGTEYVELLGSGRILGARVFPYAMLFPRYGIWIDDVLLPSNSIPNRWKWACFEAAELAARGEQLHNVIDDKRDVSRKVVEGIETEFFGPHSEVRAYPRIERLIEQFLNPPGYLERG